MDAEAIVPARADAMLGCSIIPQEPLAHAPSWGDVTAIPLRTQSPADRLQSLADAGTLTDVGDALSRARPSPHLARWGIEAHADDGVVACRAHVLGRRVLMAAQDERFLRGAVGEEHGRALGRLLQVARSERPAAVVLLMASGGVRLHEANAGEVALAFALRALLDARASGIPVLALAVRDVFGGASVLASAATAVAMLPGARLGVSGPKVIATVRGTRELDPEDRDAVERLFGRDARAASGVASTLPDETAAIRAWIAGHAQAHPDFAKQVLATHDTLRRRIASSPGASLEWAPLPPGWRAAGVWHGDAPLWHRDDGLWVLAAAGERALSPRALHALDDALLASGLLRASTQQTLVLLEDSLGHEASVAAERAGLAAFLAHHASVLALLRHAGVRVRALLCGTGHSAAFFAGALQAPVLHALEHARVVAMETPALARVTGLSPDVLAELVERDPVLGHTAHAFAQCGAVARMHRTADASALAALLA